MAKVKTAVWLSCLWTILSILCDRGLSLSMPKSKKQKHYAVARGRRNGIFNSWDECKKQVNGFGGAKYKSFPTRPEAEAWIAQQHGGAGAAAGGARSGAGVPSRAAAARPARSFERAERRRDSARSAGGAASTAAAAAAAPPPSSNELRIDVHFDGGARGNPGVGGAGAVVVSTSGGGDSAHGPTVSTTASIRRFCGMDCTNNVAEYTGMLEGLRCAREAVRAFVTERRRRQSDGEAAAAPGDGRWRVDVAVRGDSNLIIKQMNGEYAVKNAKLKLYFNECRDIAAELVGMSAADGEVEVSFSHVYRESNKIADALANEAMDQKRSWTTVD